MPFGNYSGVLVSASSTVSVTCTNTTPYNVSLDPGLSTGATVSNRSMTGGGVLLNYSLYRDSAHTLNWGSTVGTDTLAGIGNGSPQSLTVYGQLSAAQFITPGSYNDTVTATVTY
jgi:spore coat protein U-like protein